MPSDDEIEALLGEPVRIKAKLRLGLRMRPVQEFSKVSPEQLPTPKSTASASSQWQRPSTWRLEDGTEPLEIEDDGCTQSYGVFGAPGSGKTHLLKLLLRQMFGFAPNDPDRRFGGLILDPKGSLLEDVRKLLKGHPRERDLVVIDGTATQPADCVNVIDCALPVRELARLLVLAAQSAGVNAREPFWFMAWTNVFGATMTLLRYAERRELTIRRVMNAIAERGNKREITAIASDLQRRLADRAYAEECADELGTVTPDEVVADIERAIAELSSFLSDRKDHIATLEAFWNNAYGEFTSERLRCLNGGPGYGRSLSWMTPGRPGRRLSLYDSILEEGKIVVVSLPPSQPGLAKTMCTLVKCLFQQTVLTRKARIRARDLTNWYRVVFLACDEYSEIASEVPGQPAGDGRFFALAREFGCMGLLATQSIHVLENSSLREAWKAVFGNFAAKAFFASGDMETAKLATELVGAKDWQTTSYSRNYSGSGTTYGEQVDVKERPGVPTTVLTDTLKQGQALVIGSLRGHGPSRMAQTAEHESTVAFVHVGKTPPKEVGRA